MERWRRGELQEHSDGDFMVRRCHGTEEWVGLQENRTPLLWAAEMGQDESVRWLLAHGGTFAHEEVISLMHIPNAHSWAQAQRGDTALHVAAAQVGGHRCVWSGECVRGNVPVGTLACGSGATQGWC